MYLISKINALVTKKWLVSYLSIISIAKDIRFSINLSFNQNLWSKFELKTSKQKQMLVVFGKEQCAIFNVVNVFIHHTFYVAVYVQANYIIVCAECLRT